MGSSSAAPDFTSSRGRSTVGATVTPPIAGCWTMSGSCSTLDEPNGQTTRPHCLDDFSFAHSKQLLSSINLVYPAQVSTGCGGYFGNRRSVCDSRQSKKREPFAETTFFIWAQASQRLWIILAPFRRTLAFITTLAAC